MILLCKKGVEKMWIFVLILVLFILSFFIPAPEWYQKQKRMEKLFAQKTLSRTQKIKLTRTELCAKRGVKRVPKNDVLWNVYQWECAEYLARELWLDYENIKWQMWEILYEEKKYRQAIEQWLEVDYIRMCQPYYDETGSYPRQPFMSREILLSSTSETHGLYYTTYFIECLEELNLSLAELKDIFMNLLIPQIPFTLTREEAWQAMETQLIQQGIY